MVQSEEEVCLESNTQSMYTGRLWQSTFRERFCELFQCDHSEFETQVFWRCLHRHAWLPARILYSRDPAIFREDFDFIRELGTVRDPLIFKSELNRYHGRNVRERGWVRGTFVIRVSARRIITLKNRLFRSQAE